MRVLMLSTDSRIFEEGSAVRERMVEYGSLFQELHIVVYTRIGFKEKKIAENVYVYPTNTKYKLLYYWRAYRLCRNILQRKEHFVVTSQDAMNNFLAVFLKKRFSCILQIQIHTDFKSPYFKKAAFKNSLHYFGYMVGLRFADCVRVVSTRIADSLKIQSDTLKVNPLVPVVLPIRIEMERIKTAPFFDLRSRYPAHNFFILWVGRLEQEKNAELAILSMQYVIKNNPHAALIILGEGSKKEALKRLRDRLGLRQHVIFEGTRDDLIVYYKSSNVLLVTSWYEGYGRQIIEARVAGLPVISTHVGVAEEAGARIVPWDEEKIAQAIFEAQRKTNVEKYVYSYEDKGEYLTLYKNTFTQCKLNHQKKL